MKGIALIFFFLVSLSLPAQQLIPRDTVDIRLDKIRVLNHQIDSANAIGNFTDEMALRMKLIELRVTEYGENSTSYEELLILEKLMEQHSNVTIPDSIFLQFNIRMGWILEGQSNYKESLIYLERAVEAAQKTNNDDFYITANANRGLVLGRLDRIADAKNIFDELRINAIETNDSTSLYYVYEKLTDFYLNQGKVDSSLIYAKKSLNNFSPPRVMTHRYSRVALCLLILSNGEKMDSIIHYANKSLKLAEQEQLKRSQIEAHNILKFAYSLQGDYKNAYSSFNKFYELEQELRSFDDALLIGNLNTKREREKAALQQNLADQQLSSQRMVIWIVSAGLLLLIVGLYYISKKLKLIRIQNKIIAQEKLKAEQNERYKEQFLANMSHEIRTPMHAISGMINSLQRRNHSKDQANYLDAMKISSDNLLVILNDVLDMSKIESGSLEIAKIPIDVIEITNNVLNLLSYKAQEKGLFIHFNKPKNFPKVIQGDPVRLNQILVNLIGNAIKFTDEGGSINIHLTSIESRLQFAIQDTGRGIAKASIETIFDSFNQGEEVLTKRYAGTGLGLTITKQLVELQGGQIWVESEQGKGSTFYFELPLIELEDFGAEKKSFTEKQLKEIGKSLSGLKLLIVEDNNFNIMVVKDDLTWYIPEVDLTIAENGNEAVKKFSKNRFDVILMDVQMPEVNGYEATREIRSLEEKELRKKTPIIAMTASLLKNQIDKCYTAGMDAYIPKPYKPNDLLTTIKAVSSKA